jgi:hypothetical protein
MGEVADTIMHKFIFSFSAMTFFRFSYKARRAVWVTLSFSKHPLAPQSLHGNFLRHPHAVLLVRNLLEELGVGHIFSIEGVRQRQQ